MVTLQEDKLHAVLTIADELTKPSRSTSIDASPYCPTPSRSTLYPHHRVAHLQLQTPPVPSPSSRPYLFLRRRRPFFRHRFHLDTKTNGHRPARPSPRAHEDRLLATPGDAARTTAKDVARVQESEAQLLPASGSDGSLGVITERKLVSMPAETPRRAPGTPKRDVMPGSRQW